MNPKEGPPEKLTLHQAADALNASTTHVKGLLEQGLIANHGEGARLRVDRDSLLAYKARDDQERQAVLDELTREAQEQGHGYLRDGAGQPGQEPNAAPEAEAYATERVQEFLSEDAMTPELRARADARLKQKAAGNEPRLAPVHPGEILGSEFLKPLALSPSELARHLRLRAEDLEQLLRGERGVTADDALRLARYFSTTPEFWLNLQAQHDLEVERERLRHELEAITPRSGPDDA
ncbi:MAG: HigA family addiction module antitoxin [Truepera sp.]|jgi:addiction module HigA family antidote|nr:HigA family addiction module antitoxin [Truepera sp.]